MTPLLTSEQAAKVLGISPAVLGNWRNARRISFFQLNRKNVRFRPRDLGLDEEPARGVRWIDANEVGHILGISRQSLDGWRSKGEGPPFVLPGPLYNEIGLSAWIDAHVVAATGKPDLEIKDPGPLDRSELLTNEEAARELGYTPSALGTMRGGFGQGPRFVRIAGRVLYHKADIEAWKRQRSATR